MVKRLRHYYILSCCAAAWALGVWMFFLVQSLYFVLTGNAGDLEEAETVPDPFEKARRQAEEILSAGSR
ncbi:MAG: hypothetical protein AB9866_20740 [Syntrophobacteraceae bacterium]